MTWPRPCGASPSSPAPWASLTVANFHRAATLALDAGTSLRAGDALHLACAEQAGAKAMATLDDVLGRNAQKLKIKPVEFAV